MAKPVTGITTDMDEQYLRLRHGYCEAIEAAGGTPVLIPLTGDPGIYAEMINGLLIPGGDDLDPFYYSEDMLPEVRPVPRKRSEFEFALLAEIIRRRKPVLGICYGMQLINVACGGTLYQDLTVAGKVEINHGKDRHTIEVVENIFLKKGAFWVNSTHHQAVKKLGEGLSAFAYSADRVIEAFYKEGYNFLMGVQWHPERLEKDELSLSLFRSFIKASGDDKQIL
jgi:putative glutamine amidotransferase